jgi:hypothetical protein
VARTEGEVLLAELARKVERIELDGEPQRHLNNAVRSLTSLPVTFPTPHSYVRYVVSGVRGPLLCNA